MEATLYKLNTNSFNLDSLIDKLKEVNTFLSIFDKKANEEKKIVSILTENLSSREKDILTKYYGLDGGDPMTLEEIGSEYNITKERTRQILEKTLKKLRGEALNNSINETIYRQ